MGASNASLLVSSKPCRWMCLLCKLWCNSFIRIFPTIDDNIIITVIDSIREIRYNGQYFITILISRLIKFDLCKFKVAHIPSSSPLVNGELMSSFSDWHSMSAIRPTTGTSIYLFHNNHKIRTIYLFGLCFHLVLRQVASMVLIHPPIWSNPDA